MVDNTLEKEILEEVTKLAKDIADRLNAIVDNMEASLKRIDKNHKEIEKIKRDLGFYSGKYDCESDDKVSEYLH